MNRLLPAMRYYFADQFNRTTGPVEESFLHEAFRVGAIPPGTLITPEGEEVWKPLEEVLPFYFSYRGEPQGPLTLHHIRAFASSVPEPVHVTEPGGARWLPVTDLPVAPASPPPLPVAAPVATASVPRPVHRPRRTDLPGAILAAGNIWIVYGGFRLLASAFAVAMLMRDSAALALIGLIVSIIPLFIGIAFLSIGIKTVRGTAEGVRANGFGSIGIGVVTAATQYLILPRENGTLLLVEAGLSLLLVAAGILAIGAHNRFQAWKSEPMNARSARRGRR